MAEVSGGKHFFINPMDRMWALSFHIKCIYFIHEGYVANPFSWSIESLLLALRTLVCVNALPMTFTMACITCLMAWLTQYRL